MTATSELKHSYKTDQVPDYLLSTNKIIRSRAEPSKKKKKRKRKRGGERNAQ